MTKLLTIKNVLVVSIVLALSLLAIAVQPESPPDAEIAYRWYSVLPPLLAVSLAIFTGRILISLLTAVVIGGLLNTVPTAPFSILSWGKGIDTGMSFVGASLGDTWNMQLLAFVIFTLTMISVVVVAGGLHGVVQWLSRFATGPKSAQFVTYLMGLLIFIDDYANTMIVGTAMRPVTDKKTAHV